MQKVFVRYPDDSETSPVYEFEISDGLQAFSEGIACKKGFKAFRIYMGAVEKAIDMGEEVTSKHLLLYLHEKYNTLIEELKKDLTLN